jgi:general secretion pathway protein F
MRFRVKALRGASEVALLPVDALNEAEATDYARRQGYEVVSVHREGAFGFGGASIRSAFPVIQFSQELIALLRAGLTLVEAVEILHRKEENAKHRDVLSDLLTKLRQGVKFSAALGSFPVLFSPLYVATVRANERTGSIRDALERYVSYQSQIDGIRSRIVSALIYPGLLLCVGGLVILFLLGYVVPRFSRVYRDAGERLPVLSRWLMETGQAIDGHTWSVLGGLIALAVIAYYFMSQPPAKRYFLDQVFRLPVLGPRRRIYELAQFYRTVSMLLRSGLPVLATLDMAKGMLSATLQENLERAAQQVRNGISFSQAMSAQGLTTVVAHSMMVVSERSGSLSDMLEVVAAFHEEELSRWVDRFSRVFEPILMTIIGVVVGLIVVFMYMPVFELAETIQ